MQGPGPWLNEMRGLVDGGWEGGCEGRHRVLCPFGSVCGALCVTWRSDISAADPALGTPGPGKGLWGQGG